MFETAKMNERSMTKDIVACSVEMMIQWIFLKAIIRPIISASGWDKKMLAVPRFHPIRWICYARLAPMR
eukprot:scaffold865_cov160-Ochromonas_danica.AAC.23